MCCERNKHSLKLVIDIIVDDLDYYKDGHTLNY